MKNYLIITLSVIALSSCAYTPKQIRYYDDECGIISKKFIISKSKLHLFKKRGKCANDECIALALSHVVGSAFTGPVSALVSGTVVVAGNTILWLEKKANCRKLK